MGSWRQARGEEVGSRDQAGGEKAQLGEGRKGER